MKINLLGAPFNSDGTPPEEENPAKALRDLGLPALLAAGGHVVTDYGDIAIPEPDGRRDPKTGILNLHALKETSHRLALKLGQTISPEAFSLVLGGDCAILIGIFGAFAARDMAVGLVFFDGHADFHSRETTSTGEAADCELAFLTGRGPEAIATLFNKCPLIPDEHIVAFGLRELDLIAESNIAVYTWQQMVQVGITQSAKQGLRPLATAGLPLWLHFDVDVIDPRLVPVLFPASEGLTFQQAQDFLRQIMCSGCLVGMSIACYHPNLDTTGEAGRRISAIVAHAVQTGRHCQTL